jgi:hypothetical protein
VFAPQDLHAIAEAVPRAECDVHTLTSHGALEDAVHCIVNLQDCRRAPTHPRRLVWRGLSVA